MAEMFEKKGYMELKTLTRGVKFGKARG